MADRDATAVPCLDRIRGRQVEAVYRNVTVGLVISTRSRSSGSCDYRLRGQENGIAVIHGVRAE